MSVTAAIRRMMDRGLTIEQALIASEAFEAEMAPEQPILSKRQARNKRYYEGKKASENRLKTSYSDDQDAYSLSPKERPPTPPKEITPIHSEAKASSLNPRGELQIVLDAERAKAVVDHRQRIGKPLTAHAARLLAGKLGKCVDPNFAADEMIANGWQGFKPEWMDNRQRPMARAGPPKPMSLGEMFREDARQNGILNDQPPANPPGRMETRNGDGEVTGAGDPRVIALTRNVLGGFR